MENDMSDYPNLIGAIRAAREGMEQTESSLERQCAAERVVESLDKLRLFDRLDEVLAVLAERTLRDLNRPVTIELRNENVVEIYRNGGVQVYSKDGRSGYEIKLPPASVPSGQITIHKLD